MSRPEDVPDWLSARPESERRYREALLSQEWDVGDGRAPRFQYVIVSLPRTGSEFLCATLRRRGIGVPQEYLGRSSIARRLGCEDDAGNIRLAPYFAQLHAKRTTPNGIFGLKVHALHLKSFAGADVSVAAQFLNLFDRILVLQRRDRLLQVISLVRAHLTEQFHIMPGDAARRLTQTDDALFELMATHLAGIIKDERYIASVVGLLDPIKVARLWYEDLDDAAVDGLAAELAKRAGYTGPTVEPYADHALPRRGDTEEALSLKRRFLSHVTGEERIGLLRAGDTGLQHGPRRP